MFSLPHLKIPMGNLLDAIDLKQTAAGKKDRMWRDPSKYPKVEDNALVSKLKLLPAPDQILRRRYNQSKSNLIKSWSQVSPRALQPPHIHYFDSQKVLQASLFEVVDCCRRRSTYSDSFSGFAIHGLPSTLSSSRSPISGPYQLLTTQQYLSRDIVRHSVNQI